jgi:protein-glucosylgalactosylhydroxylysine glucosidase
MRYPHFLISILFLLETSHFIYGQSATMMVEAKNINPHNYYGVTLANGVIGIVSSAEPLKVNDVVLNGAYDYYQRGRVSNILKGFNHMNMNLDVDGIRVSKGNISDYTQKLDLEHASLKTTFEMKNKVKVTTELLALRHLPYSSMIICEIEALSDVKISPMSVIEAPAHLTEVKNLFAEIDRPHVLIPLLSSFGKSPTGRLSLAATTSFIFQEPHGSEPNLIHEDWDYNMHLAKFHMNLKKGQKYSFAIVGSTCASNQYNDPLNEAERLTIFAALEGKNRLLRRHNEEWAKLWQSSITVEGDEATTRDIRFALYHLYSFCRPGTAYSLSPMGLSGLGYNGHVFWDTELWMYPPLLILQPDMAKSLLEYRFQRLAAAKKNAFSHGYAGAMFPWESSDEGQEDTPVWALTGPFQHHITGCVGWAAWKYYQVSQDKVWLKEKGYPILEAVADFWASRVERNGPGKYDINNVIGANEWQENIDNNAFTNGMAKTTLEYATLAALTLGMKANPDWIHVAQNIPILTFPDGTTRENATYNGVPIKQADVNLLAYPLEVVNDPSQIKKDLDYYVPRYAQDGPAMGTAILSILYHRLGEPEKALTLFKASYKGNEVPPFGVLSETVGGANPYFATGAGGMLQAVLAGFGGLNINQNGITQLPVKLPAGWRKLTITGVGKEEKTFEVK